MEQFCRDPKRCRQKAEQTAQRLKRVLPRAEKLHEQFLTSTHTIWATKHAIERMQERGCSPEELHSVIECGIPINYTFRPEYDNHVFVFHGEGENHRLLHVVASLPRREAAPGKWIMSILSVTDPTVYPEEWSEDFTRRVCFCYSHFSYEDEMEE